MIVIQLFPLGLAEGQAVVDTLRVDSTNVVDCVFRSGVAHLAKPRAKLKRRLLLHEAFLLEVNYHEILCQNVSVCATEHDYFLFFSDLSPREGG